MLTDNLAGTMRQATVKPDVPPTMFPVEKAQPPQIQNRIERPTPNMSRRRIEGAGSSRKQSEASDEFGDDGLDDSDLVQAAAGDLSFDHIENYGNVDAAVTRKNTAQNTSTQKGKQKNAVDKDDDEGPRQLANGKWACNHRCKDKNACKHMCCREGLDNPPKKNWKKFQKTDPSTQQIPSKTQNTPIKRDNTQTKLQLTLSKGKKSSASVEHLDLTQNENSDEYSIHGPRDYKRLQQLHTSIHMKTPPASLSAVMHTKLAYSYARGEQPILSFLSGSKKEWRQEAGSSTNFGDSWVEDMMPSKFFDASDGPRHTDAGLDLERRQISDEFGDPIEVVGINDDQGDSSIDDADSELAAAMVGLADSRELKDKDENGYEEDFKIFKDSFEMVRDDEGDDAEFAKRSDEGTPFDDTSFPLLETSSTSTVALRHATLPEKGHSMLLNDTSNLNEPYGGFKPVALLLKRDREIADIWQPAGSTTKKQKVEKKGFENIHSENAEATEREPELGLVSASPNQNIVIPPGFEDIEPWLIAEFGDIVEFV